jgi:hypothetical protein
VRSYLVVANQTLAEEQLMEEIRRRQAREPSSFHVVVPNTPPPAETLATAVQLGGPADLAATSVSETESERRATLEARNRLHHVLDRMQAEGVEASGELGDPDPFDAIEAALARGRFDEIIISTLPGGISKWLGMDLPHRVERKFDLPVTTVTATS